MHRSIVAALSLALGALVPASAFAVQTCELNGQGVNPNNGNTTQGKTGLMRCRDEEAGPVVREQELQNGVFMGAMRYFRNGAIEKDYRVNARGNRDGLYREYAAAAAAAAGTGAKPVLVREETYRDGSTVGIVRSWYPTGTLKRVAFHGDDSNEQASAEFTEQGQLSSLRCGQRAVLGSDFDDASACGHGGLSNVTLYGGKGQPRARVAYERGERRRYEQLWDSGSVRELQETGAASGVERSFAADGIKRKETAWLVEPVPAGRPASERPRRLLTLEQEFHESGKLVQEKRYRPGPRGSELASEQHWYLNGQPRDLTEYLADGNPPMRRETAFHDNGKKASEGSWSLAPDGRRYGAQPIGVHRSWDADGRLRSERTYDAKGRVTRERDLDASGAVVRDDEVFEDGSRKAYGK